jgi:hypothetical protein
MALTTTVQTLTEFRNVCSQLMGFTAYTDLSTVLAAHVDNALGFALDQLSFEGGWKWSERQGYITSTAGYSTGTVTVTNLDATVEGAGTPAWTTSSAVLADDIFNVGEGGFYRVASITDADTLELQQAFGGTTAAGASYNTYRDRYDMADGVLELTSFRLNDPARNLTILGPLEWEALTHGDYQVGEPEYAMLVGADASEAGNTGTNQKIQLWPFPDDTYAFTYSYRSLLTLPSTGTDNLEVGPHLSTLLVYKAMQEIFRQMQEPDRSAEYLDSYQRLLLLAKRSELTRTRGATYISAPQWDRHGGTWPINWGPVTNK